MSERKLKWYYKDKLARLGYIVEGLDLHQLKEINEEHKRKKAIRKDVIDEDVKEFYRIKEEPESVHKEKIPEGISPLLYDKKSKSIKFVGIDGKELDPKKKEDKKTWKF